ncbi:DUF5991 domain-containing protein [Terrimonas alba]|uniref:DUF5991 domain-containing protein n=1 Tax=Terrimonas alba TaxID=3349636 RepID=UPI0035F285D9
MQNKRSRLVWNYLIILVIIGCSESNKLDSWLGDYNYSEPPIKSLAGYNMVMSWDLSVNKIDKFYKAILNVNGQQTTFSLLNDLKGNDSTLYVIYDQSLSGRDPNLQKGDTLFVLSKAAIGIKTKWSELSPILSEQPPKECNCFVFAGVNENNNTLRVSR